MPIKSSSLSIKALPLEVINKEQSVKVSQILSPSSILPTTALFTLQITTEAAKLTYKITAQQSNNLMQKSALFYDLSTQYNDYTSDNNSAINFSLEELVQEANGLPMLYIELPNISVEIVDNLLQWLFSNNEIKYDILTSNLAANIKSTLDFFGLLNFVTLLNLYEPYCSIIDEILVWYYFGLSEQERNLEILKNESFIEGSIPARFVKRLAESVSEFEENQILSNFFRGKISSEEIFSTKRKINIGNENEWEELSLTEHNSVDIEKSRYNIFEWLNSSVTPTRRVNFSLPNSPSPLDVAEPPTPLGSAYFCISPPPNTPSSPTFHRILPRSLPRTPKTATFAKSIQKSILERVDIFEDIPLTAGLPPNTPNIVLPSNNSRIDDAVVPLNTLISPANLIVPPNTPNFQSSLETPLAPPNTPNTPFSPISSSYSGVAINGLLSPTSIPFSRSSTPISVPPNTPTSPFIFQSSSYGNSKNSIPRKNSRDVIIDSVLANSLSDLQYIIGNDE